METCTDQANCLDVYMDSRTCTSVTAGSSSWLYCQVCLYWNNDRGTCAKSTQDSFSHVCMGDQFYPTMPTPGSSPTMGDTQKLEGWGFGVASEWGAASLGWHCEYPVAFNGHDRIWSYVLTYWCPCCY